MNSLLEYAVDAHGGLARWRRLHAFVADVSVQGALWQLKGRPDVLAETRVVTSLCRQSLEIDLKCQDKTILFTPTKVTIESADGRTIERRDNPRASFVEQTTPWDDIHVGYFSGYAQWQYFTAPFLYTYPGFEVEELQPWQEADETWRVLKIVFPSYIAAHTRVQYAYFGSDGLLRRHQYTVDVLGGATGVNYASGYQEVSGIMVPAERRVFAYDDDLRKVSEPLLISIDISSAQFIESGSFSVFESKPN